MKDEGFDNIHICKEMKTHNQNRNVLSKIEKKNISFLWDSLPFHSNFPIEFPLI